MSLPNGPFSETFTDHIFYTTVQPYVAIGPKSVKIILGARIGLFTHSYGRYYINYVDGGWDHKTSVNKTRRKHWDYGLITGTKFVLNKRFNLLCTYYYGLQDLVKDLPEPSLNDERFVRQLTIGVSYLIKDYAKQVKCPTEN